MKRMILKKSWPLFGPALWMMLLTLAGCNGAPPSLTATTLPTLISTSEPTLTATPTATPLPSLVTLHLWAPDFLNPYDETSGAGVLNDQLMAFSEIYPDVQVQVIVKKATGSGGLYNLLSTAYVAAPSVLPDLIVLSQNDLAAAVAGGLVQPISSTTLVQSDFFPFSLEGLRKDAAIYGIPWVARADQMVYRSGISATPPFSWTDVLTRGYSLLFPAAPVNGYADDALVSMYLGSGGTVVDEAGVPALDRAVLEQLYRFFAELKARNLINTERTLTLADAVACWDTYQKGIGRLSPVPIGVYWAEPPNGSLPAWAPTIQGGPITIAHGWSLAIVTSDPFRQEAAQQLALWLSSPKQMGDLTRATLLVPTRDSAFAQWGLLPEDTAFLTQLLEKAVPTLPPAVDLPVRRALQAGMAALLKGEAATPEDAATYALTNLRK